MNSKNPPGAPAATALVVASMIGTGVFVSLGYQLVDFRSAPQVLMLWFLGGMLALCGALSYSALADALPRSGGEYHYLGKIYHPSLGFMAGLLSAIVGFTAPTAITALALGGYMHKAVPEISDRAAAAVVIIAGAAAHGLSAKASARVQLASTLLKLALIVLFIGAAILLPGAGNIRWAPEPSTDLPAISTPAFAVGLYWVFYAYSGWNAAVYGLEEWNDGGQTVRRALVYGTMVVVTLYLALNSAFLAAAPVEKLRGEEQVGHIAAVSLFGESAGRAISLLFAIGLFASVSALLWAGPRVLGAMARDVPALRWFSSDADVPLRPLIFQSAIALAFVFGSNLRFLVTYTQTGLALCTLLSAAGLFVLRQRGRQVPISALVPAGVFSAATLFVIICSFFADSPASMIIGLVTALICALLWFPLNRIAP